MTEQDWLDETDPERMLAFVRGGASDRKLRLFLTALCRLMWPNLVDERSRCAVEAAERYADGQLSEAELAVACRGAERAREESWSEKGMVAADTAVSASRPDDWMSWAAQCAAVAAGMGEGYPDPEAQADLLRDLLGNPFHPISLEGDWLTAAVLAVGWSSYADRRFEDLPILGDALEDAGCTHQVILDHCRRQAGHVRGCWLVDLVLRQS